MTEGVVVQVDGAELQNGLHHRQANTSQRPVRLALACANSLDGDAIGQWLRNSGYPYVHAYCDWRRLVQWGLPRPVDLLIADGAMPGFDVAAAVDLVRRHTCKLLVLDDRPREGRLAALLKAPQVSYVSRQAGATELLHTLDDILRRGRRVFDPAVAGRIRRSRSGLRLTSDPDGASICQLSKRELEVMVLLAKGASVPEAAEALRLSTSTVDNHRSRLMKKLGVHKATELTCRAIRDGLLPAS